MKNFALVAMVLAAFSMTACENMQNSGTKEKVGTASGAVIGGILGSKVGGGSGQLWATGAGVLVGALLGSEIGKSLDRADMQYAQQANTRAHSAPIGETVSWNNPESGNYGSITPTRDGYSSAGRYCREYQQTIVVGGREEQAYGTACQQPDGSWEIID
ncbi:MAG: glycine zipper 2TM domain-containing protein [Alphaproteobacteria bacterium]|nr:glycine zipper 2TM domain-containing protein [Alphaproteobacteria bacterium]